MHQMRIAIKNVLGSLTWTHKLRRQREGAKNPTSKKNSRKIFFWQVSCKIQAFSGKYH